VAAFNARTPDENEERKSDAFHACLHVMMTSRRIRSYFRVQNRITPHIEKAPPYCGGTCEGLV
jgi:hypothetical protein